MNGIVWLASYPKSGNTWFRAFLTNLLHDRDIPASINSLEGTRIASAREIFDEFVGLESSELTDDEIDRLRPELYCHLAESAKGPLYMKIHDAYTEIAPGKPLIPASAASCAIYFVRNPLDVAVSFAHHNGWDYDATITGMARQSLSFCKTADRWENQLRQKLLSWSGHVLSWTNQTPFPVCTLRYEDMKATPLETFTGAVRFVGLSHTIDQIKKALAFSAFDILQAQEKANGFREKYVATKRFFRKGESGSWREELSKDQVQRIVHDHGAVMRRFGYLDEVGSL